MFRKGTYFFSKHFCLQCKNDDEFFSLLFTFKFDSFRVWVDATILPKLFREVKEMWKRWVDDWNYLPRNLFKRKMSEKKINESNLNQTTKMHFSRLYFNNFSKFVWFFLKRFFLLENTLSKWFILCKKTLKCFWIRVSFDRIYLNFAMIMIKCYNSS